MCCKSVIAATVGFAVAVGAYDDCKSYYASQSFVSDVSAPKQWCNEGSYFAWRSPSNGGREVNVFYRCAGDSGKPAIVLGHGWPTSSYDFQDLSALLEPHLYVCAVDYVGHGFSDKPANLSDAPYQYRIMDHAQLIHDLAVRLKLERFSYLTHDEGSSVGFALLQLLEGAAAAGAAAPFELTHHFILDGSIYRPAANITASQERLLSNETGPAAQERLTPSELALGLGAAVYTPRRTLADDGAMASVFAYRNGTHVLHETIQYLVDRHEHEVEWLEVLRRSTVNASLIWGMRDPVAVPAVADYVWENYLKNRPNGAPSTYTQLPDANHYLQVDHAADVAGLVLGALGY